MISSVLAYHIARYSSNENFYPVGFVCRVLADAFISTPIRLRSYLGLLGVSSAEYAPYQRLLVRSAPSIQYWLDLTQDVPRHLRIQIFVNAIVPARSIEEFLYIRTVNPDLWEALVYNDALYHLVTMSDNFELAKWFAESIDPKALFDPSSGFLTRPSVFVAFQPEMLRTLAPWICKPEHSTYITSILINMLAYQPLQVVKELWETLRLRETVFVDLQKLAWVLAPGFSTEFYEWIGPSITGNNIHNNVYICIDNNFRKEIATFYDPKLHGVEALKWRLASPARYESELPYEGLLGVYYNLAERVADAELFRYILTECPNICERIPYIPRSDLLLGWPRLGTDAFPWIDEDSLQWLEKNIGEHIAWKAGHARLQILTCRLPRALERCKSMVRYLNASVQKKQQSNMVGGDIYKVLENKHPYEALRLHMYCGYQPTDLVGIAKRSNAYEAYPIVHAATPYDHDTLKYMLQCGNISAINRVLETVPASLKDILWAIQCGEKHHIVMRLLESARSGLEVDRLSEIVHSAILFRNSEVLLWIETNYPNVVDMNQWYGRTLLTALKHPPCHRDTVKGILEQHRFTDEELALIYDKISCVYWQYHTDHPFLVDLFRQFSCEMLITASMKPESSQLPSLSNLSYPLDDYFPWGIESTDEPGE